jgi:hypothetical protein
MKIYIRKKQHIKYISADDLRYQIMKGIVQPCSDLCISANVSNRNRNKGNCRRVATLPNVRLGGRLVEREWTH